MLKVLYAGSPNEAATVLKTLVALSNGSTYKVVAALTNTPKSKGRHKALIPTPVATVAKELGIPLIESDHCDGATREAVSAFDSDILVCFAYGRIFGPKFMATFPLGGINLHPSLLPRWRGPAPANFAVLNGDATTGLSIQKITQELDSGAIILQKVIPLSEKSTAGYIMEKASSDGAQLLISALLDIARNMAVPIGTDQTGTPTFSTFITKETTKLTFNRSAKEVDRFVRAFYPSPLSWVRVSDNGEVSDKNPLLKIIEGTYIMDDKSPAQLLMYKNSPFGAVCLHDKNLGIAVRCTDGYYFITKLQLQGKNPLTHDAFINGARGFIGKILV